MKNLLQLRKQIDQLDDRLVKLLNRRLRLAEKIGDFKAHHRNSVYNRYREHTLLKRLCTHQQGSLTAKELHAIYQCILQASRNHQKRVFQQIQRGLHVKSKKSR